MYHTDILIIGAGPAGNTAARLLADEQRQVLLIDKATFPRDKVCAGGVPQRTAKLLALDYSHLVEQQVNHIALCTGNKKNIEIQVQQAADIIKRSKFDNFLLEKAKESGAEFSPATELKNINFTGGKWLITAKKANYSEITANHVVVCDGALSKTAKCLGLQTGEHGLALEGYIAIPESTSTIARETASFEFSTVRGGYFWIFPGKDEFTVGIGSSFWHSPKLKQQLLDTCSKLSVLNQIAPRRIKGAALPYFKKPLPWYVKDNLYLCGDAAGLVDPLTGEGIYYAVLSGKLAAEAIIKQNQQHYQKELKQQLLPDLIIASHYAWRARWLPRWLFALCLHSKRYQKYTEKFAQLLSGQITYRQLYCDMHWGRQYRGLKVLD